MLVSLARFNIVVSRESERDEWIIKCYINDVDTTTTPQFFPPVRFKREIYQMEEWPTATDALHDFCSRLEVE